MAYNTKNIIRDAAGAPVPQYFNPTTDAYEPLYGRNNANRVELYGPDGNPISTTSGKLDVRASEIEALAGALTDAAVTDPAASATIIALLKGLLKQHQGGGTVKDQVDVIDRATRALGKIIAEDNAIAALGALAATAVIDPAASASVIALLKGLLKQLQGTGTGSAPVQLTGSYATIDSAPVVGAKTVTTTAAELFASASRLANRYAMIVYNESSVPVYWGPSGVTAATGFPLLPQDSVVFQFNSSVATAIYFIAASNAAVRVVELA
ncbi:MAG: hypothetical protein H5U02_00250 [Clostridia bacterium]|nr:hypothetical protein [Clostridia bacterium]